MPYILQTNDLTKTIDGKEIIKKVNLHIKKEKFMVFLAQTVQVKPQL